MITEVKGSVEKEQKIKSNRKAYLEKEITKMATKSAGYQA